MNCIYYRHEFRVIKCGNDFVVINTKKPFINGHTHFTNFNGCISAIKLVERKELPKSRSKRVIKSLQRLSTDKLYIEQLDDLLIDFKDMMEHNKDVILR